ncbi:MAG: TrkH family potassium uptake protein [Salinisphaera sp.]|nr:TrkH family potassium uptake protein [Salinisphaera sp.]
MTHRYAVTQRLLGLLVMLFSTTMLIPLVIALGYADGEAAAFAMSFAITLVAGFVCWLPVRSTQRDLKVHDGFLVVALFWVVLSGFGALPLLFAQVPDMSVTDAIYESVSGLTTTGATVLVGIDGLPHGILLWRMLLHFFGGMGVIVLAVAVLPLLAVGGMQLYRAETPGPIKDAKLTPRIRETAKALWLVYVGLTIACALAYWLAGMSLFDAVGHAFSTLSTGGFSNHDASIGYFDSALIEAIAVVFMFLGAVNFSLHFAAFRRGSLGAYWRDAEFHGWLWLVVGATALCTVVLLTSGYYSSVGTAVLKALFQVVSIGSTTGFLTADYTQWPTFIPVMLILGTVVGGCGGSTSGGIKVSRFLLLIKQGLRELKRQVHPSAELPVKFGGRVIPHSVLEAVWGFFSIYIGIYAFSFLLLIATGMDEISAFSAVAACLNNTGPGLGEVTFSMAGIPIAAKWILCADMLVGRLEIFTLLVVLTPAFWRR